MIRDSNIRRRTKQPSAALLLKVRRLRWFGHVVRMDEQRLPLRLLKWCPEQVGGRRRRRRTRVRWLDAVVRDATVAGVGNNQ